MNILPPLAVALPLSAAALLAGLNRHIGRRISSLAAIAVAAATLWISIELLIRSIPNTIVYWFGNWQPRHGIALGISFVIDPAGAAMASIAGLLTLAALIFSSKYFDSIGTLFHVLMLVFLGAMSGFALTGDLFNLFVFFELMSAAAYGLCGYKTEEPAPVQGALNFAVTNTVGCYFMLTGIGLVYARTGALNLAQIGHALDQGGPDPLVIAAFTFMACGFFVKAAVVPFHFWLADAHAVAPTPVCVLYSGIMVELAVYAVARVYWTAFSGAFASGTQPLRALLVTMGIATALVGGGMCFGQRNLKRLLAFSTISHVGLMAIGFGFLDVHGLAGALLQILGHAGAKSGLFLCAGIILHRCRTVDEMELKGKTRNLPFTMGALVVAAAALGGSPLSGISVGDTMLESAARHEGYGWIVWVSTAADVLTSAAIFRFAARTYANLGPAQAREPEQPQKTEEKPETDKGSQDTPAVMFIPAALLTVASLLLGVSQGLQRFMVTAAGRFEDHAGYVRRVLDNVPVSLPVAATVPHEDMLHGVVTVGIAFALGVVFLVWERGRKSLTAVARPVMLVRDLHSGHVGDYVTWVVFGIAAFGAAALLSLR